MIRVGRRKYSKNGKYTDPEYPGFTPILCLTEKTAYSSLSPYCLKNSRGEILENIWQFSKVYYTIPNSVQRISRYNSTVIWSHPAETHIDADGNITDEYFKWRKKGMKNPYPVRYPVGYYHRHKCVYALQEQKDCFVELDYIEARKEIYLPDYLNTVVKQEQFEELKNRFDDGEKLLIIEVDGPHEESMSYYREKYGVKKDFITKDTVICTKKNLNIFLNDPKHPFGHGYCLAWAIQGF